MTVFTLPSYNIVFKIIKDKFAPPKEVTHQTVREKVPPGITPRPHWAHGGYPGI